MTIPTKSGYQNGWSKEEKNAVFPGLVKKLLSCNISV